eukprot:6465592-Amphidinium_carterae.1
MHLRGPRDFTLLGYLGATLVLKTCAWCGFDYIGIDNLTARLSMLQLDCISIALVAACMHLNCSSCIVCMNLNCIVVAATS